jgi:DNA-binding MarR family transcriptional regulator
MSKDNATQTDMLFTKFQTLVSVYKELENSPKKWGTDVLITSAEIHFLETIGNKNGELSITDLAAVFGITKGAVSQRIIKLETKGLVKKKEDPNNESKLNLYLTRKGVLAFKTHLKWHDSMDGGYKEYLSSLEKEKVVFLNQFMSNVIEFMRRAQSAE